MAFHITVRRLADPLPPDSPESSDPSSLDKWLAKCVVGEVYSNPLGAQDIVYRWWYLPAQRLSLALLGSVYPDGLDVFDSDLDLLASELDALERYWLASGLEAEPPLMWMAFHEDGSRTEGHISLKDHLQERAGYMREAIDAARGQAGVVSIA